MPMPAKFDNPLISVVIINYNGTPFLKDCMPALFSQECRHFDVIFVDNASSDNSVDYVRIHYPGVQISRQLVNIGFSGGANAGIREAKGDFILTLNPDATVSPGFISELIRPMSDPKVGMCASKMILPDGRINSTGICISRSGAAWDRGMNETDNGQYDTQEEVFGPSGGAALYRRAMFDEIGLFDEDFFLYMEDVDLAFRGRLAGWKCIYVPTARVFHVHCGTTGYRSSLSIYYGNRNLIWYIIKNFPFRTLLLCSPWIIGRNLADIPYYLLQGKGMAIIKAKINMIRGLGGMIKKRVMIKRIVPDAEIERWIHVWSHRIKD
jgi:GT2 family glycosyltransferase